MPRRPSTSCSVSRGLVVLDRRAVLPDRRAGRGEGDGAEHVGAAGLVAGGAGGPAHRGLGDLRGGAAAGEVGLRGIQPVAATGEHAGAVGGVHLVPRERDPVDVERAEVDRPVRRELGGVEQHARAVPAGDGGQPLDRPELAGDVGCRGEHDERLARAAGGAGGQGLQRALEQHLGVAGAAGHGQAHGVAAAPGQQRRVVLGGEDDHRGVAGQRPGEQVDRVGGAAGEDDDVVLAGAHEAGHLVAGGLVVAAGDPREPAGAAVHAGVGARRGLDGPRHPLEGRGGCRVVEVGVVDEVARQGRHQVGAHDERQVAGRRLDAGRWRCATASGTARSRGRRWKVGVGLAGAVAGDRHGGYLRWSQGPRV